MVQLPWCLREDNDVVEEIQIKWSETLQEYGFEKFKISPITDHGRMVVSFSLDGVCGAFDVWFTGYGHSKPTNYKKDYQKFKERCHEELINNIKKAQDKSKYDSKSRFILASSHIIPTRIHM